MTSNPSISSAEYGKLASAHHAQQFIESGMRVGLGTGSTAAWLVKLIGWRIKRDGLQIVGVPTSSRTAELAERVGIPITTLDEAGGLDLTVDGADEFDPDLTLIKGGGGALLQEKIVASASDKMVVITDPSKEVDVLGTFPLPVEVVRFGWETTHAAIEDVLDTHEVFGRQIALRQDRGQPYVTDEKHYIFDLHLRKIVDAPALAAALNMIPGVVETGLFIDIATAVIIGDDQGRARYLSKTGEAQTLPAPDAPSLDDMLRDLG